LQTLPDKEGGREGGREGAYLAFLHVNLQTLPDEVQPFGLSKGSGMPTHGVEEGGEPGRDLGREGGREGE
jgi:hypothetical protein